MLWHFRLLALAALTLGAAAIGCAKVAVEGGDKPIHIVMDINLKIDRELDQFFAFEQTGAATRPTSTMATGQ
jgi:hypothetical protein